MTGKLILSNGASFTGSWHGTQTAVQGEVVFFTGMTGYEEVITDPSYKGQVIVFSYPLIGQYGIELLYAQSEKIQASGIIVAELYAGPLPKQAISLAQFAKRKAFRSSAASIHVQLFNRFVKQARCQHSCFTRVRLNNRGKCSKLIFSRMVKQQQ